MAVVWEEIQLARDGNSNSGQKIVDREKSRKMRVDVNFLAFHCRALGLFDAFLLS
jgi:hypothetical protein